LYAVAAVIARVTVAALIAIRKWRIAFEVGTGQVRYNQVTISYPLILWIKSCEVCEYRG
jgi:hypothetical protein